MPPSQHPQTGALEDRFDDRFQRITGIQPRANGVYASYPWQRRLHAALVAGEPPDSLDIPTGVGKTTAVLVALLAFLEHPGLPRRIAYIVDRRAVVDQTAATIEGWIQNIASDPELAALFDQHAGLLGDTPVALGIARGGLADDGAWRADPSRPAVVVGTTDMLGSKLLFRGYGDGPSRRAMHAGLLGHDSFVLLDEAHLSAPLAYLLGDLRAVNAAHNDGRFHALTLSATLPGAHTPFRLNDDDLADERIGQRLNARKTLHLHEVERAQERPRAIAETAESLAATDTSVAVFVTSVEQAKQVAEQLRRNHGDRVVLLTGTHRGHERVALAESDAWARFSPDRERAAGSPASFLVTTAAGEVGVDFDADHGVMDAVPADRMIQRFGRINRCGLAAAEVHVVYDAKQAARERGSRPKEQFRRDQAAMAALQVLQALPDVSPANVTTLAPDSLENAKIEPAQPVPLHGVTVESLAATSADIPLPETALFLRGISDAAEPPDTYLLWRWDVPEIAGRTTRTLADVVSTYPPRAAEVARVPTTAAERIIKAAAKRMAKVQADQPAATLPLIVLDTRGQPVRDVAHITPDDDLPDLQYATVILPAHAGGLSPAGLPDETAAGEVVDVADQPDVTDHAYRTRWVETAAASEGSPPGTLQFRVPLHDPDDEDAEPRWLVYETRTMPAAGGDSDAGSRLARHQQRIEEHNERVASVVAQLADALGVAHEVREALTTAARCHDTGKARGRWQRAAGGSDRTRFAKTTRGRFQPELLAGYRHEFGSLIDVTRDTPGDTSAPELTLHLVAAHHGHARPGFPERRQWDPDAPNPANEQAAHEAARRFGRLQAAYGAWRLAWLEALLKAADAWVSAERDREGTP